MAATQKARLETPLWTSSFQKPVAKEIGLGWTLFELVVDLPGILFRSLAIRLRKKRSRS